MFRRDYGLCLVQPEVLGSHGVHADPQNSSTLPGSAALREDRVDAEHFFFNLEVLGGYNDMEQWGAVDLEVHSTVAHFMHRQARWVCPRCHGSSGLNSAHHLRLPGTCTVCPAP